jgi:hypothetical protein
MQPHLLPNTRHKPVGFASYNDSSGTCACAPVEFTERKARKGPHQNIGSCSDAKT